MDFTDFLLAEVRRHPSAAPQDIVKQCYQSAFGAEHMLTDVSKAEAYFYQEYETTPADDRPLIEYIAQHVCRVNIAAWKRHELNAVWLWRLFYSSITANSMKNNPGQVVFANLISTAEVLTKADKMPFSYNQWQEYINDYNKLSTAHNRLPPVRHSPKYRENETPAYRIVTGTAINTLPIFEAMKGQANGVIAIDGRAAAGKTTFAKKLSMILHGEDYANGASGVNNTLTKSATPAATSTSEAPTTSSIIAMDDFFLPPSLRTPDRLAKPGGNIHHERFTEEVLPNINISKPFKYRKFDCSIMDYSGQAQINTHPWRIVEGVYSCHPILGDYMDIRVFMDIDPKTQQDRINNRNTPKMAENYINKWIPMEEAYFNAYKLREAANIVI